MVFQTVADPATRMEAAGTGLNSSETKAMENLVVTEMDSEPRVSDEDLARALQFKNGRQIRELIGRNEQELQSFGNLSYRTTNSGSRGRPGTRFYLNEPQALLICMFSRTPKAAEVRKLVIQVFMDWRAGRSTPAVQEAPDGHKNLTEGEYFSMFAAPRDKVRIDAVVPEAAAMSAFDAWARTL